MKRNLIVFLVFSILAMTSCSNSNEDFVSQPTVEPVTEIQTNLNALNNTYSHNVVGTRSIWGFLRKLAVCCADAAGFIWGGKLAGATALSELADKYLPAVHSTKTSDSFVDPYGIVTESEPKQFRPDSLWNGIVKQDALSDLDSNELGYAHNKVILDHFKQGKLPVQNPVYAQEEDQDVNQILSSGDFKQFEGSISSDKLYFSDQFTTQTLKDIIEPIKSNNNISVAGYINALVAKTDDNDIKDQLKIVGQVLEGLQYVGDNDTSYITKAREIIMKSKVSKQLQDKLLDAISIAYASSKLWVTPVVKNAPVNN